MGQTRSSGRAGGLHPGPNAGTLPSSLVQRGTSAQHRPRLCLHPQPRPALLGLRGWLRAAHTSELGAGALRAHGARLGQLLVSGWGGEGGVWAGSTLGTPRAVAKQASPASPGGVDRPRGLPGDGRDPGWGDQNPSHPVLKAPAISLPCHWPGHSKAPGPHPATQGVRLCPTAPSGSPLARGAPGGEIQGHGPGTKGAESVLTPMSALCTAGGRRVPMCMSEPVCVEGMWPCLCAPVFWVQPCGRPAGPEISQS